MTEPLWGAHPHFTQFGLDRLFGDMLERCGTEIDVIEVHFDGPGRYRMQALCYPDFTQPTSLPDGTVWLANPERSRAGVTLDQADPDHAVRDAITSLAVTMPYRDIGHGWPYGTPSLEVGREGASLKMPIEVGNLVIYTEGREKTLAPDKPFWTSMVSVYHDRRHIPASDILAAGGEDAYLLERLLEDPHVSTPPGTTPLSDRRFTTGMMAINLPLDTYLQEIRP